MSCRTPILRGVYDSETLQAVSANGNIGFTSVTKNTNGASVTDDVIHIRQAGTYELEWNATMSAAAAGTEEVQLFVNGTAVPGSHALGTAAAAGDLVPMSAAGVTSIECCGNTAITLRSVPATNVRVANFILYKID